MNKNILVSFLLIASVLFAATAVSAAELDLTDSDSTSLYVDGVNLATLADVDPLSVIAGDTIEVKVVFLADDVVSENTKNVRVKVTLEGENDDVVASTRINVEMGNTYRVPLTLKVPSELKDSISGSIVLRVEIEDTEFTLDDEAITLHVQRPSYDFAIKSVSTSNSINAGQIMPVEVVLKNVGYNDADDVYITVSVPELNIKQSGYLGDLVAIEDCDDDCDLEDTASATLKLNVPYGAKTGVYTLEVTAKNDETTNTVKKEITIENGVSDVAIKSGNNLVVLNPTDQLKVYTVKYNSEVATVVVPAGSSSTVPITVPTGDYKFDVVVYSGETVLSTVEFNGTSTQTSGVQLTNPVLVLTVILSIVFLVLLVVLVVLITKKPQKTEEFGESYY